MRVAPPATREASPIRREGAAPREGGRPTRSEADTATPPRPALGNAQRAGRQAPDSDQSQRAHHFGVRCPCEAKQPDAEVGRERALYGAGGRPPPPPPPPCPP